ncbi:hypothetical protein MKW92_005844 [Papaver armeniacum]|nr:hypothetical protein MKW92_005844 [Papaver armeniacum]
MASEIEEEKSDSSSPHVSEISFPFETYMLENQKAKLLVNPFEVERELVYPRPKAYYQGVLDKILKSWRRKPEKIKRDVAKYRKGKWLAFGFVFLLVLIVVITVPIVTQKPKRAVEVPRADNYSIALKQALLFFDAQKSGHLVHNRIPWRGDSGLHDGGGKLVGGFYDGGDNIKYTFPTAFSMTMLSWSVLEFGHHYRATGEYDHVTEIIRWGVDYILKTFDSSSNFTVSHIYSQVGVAKSNSTMPDDGYCWQRPEDVTYRRSFESVHGGPDLAGEMIAALASASLVFREDLVYSQKLIKGAEKLVEFCSLPEHRYTYTAQKKNNVYNSSDFHDEELWAATWLFYATGNYEYLSRATNERLAAKTKLFSRTPSLWILSYDNKLPGALLLLTRLRIILGVPYPFEDMLQIYHKVLEKMMCSYMHQYGVFEFTKGGLIDLGPMPLQYSANTAYISAVFAGYLQSQGIPSWACGPNYIMLESLKNFSTTQVNYILGENPKNISYVVGFGHRFPRQVYHRAASIPRDGRPYSCTEGFQWRDYPGPNPHNITGAMVGGPDKMDRYRDNRKRRQSTEPTLVGNAALVAALASLTNTGGSSIDVTTIFAKVERIHTPSPAPPSPWVPFQVKLILSNDFTILKLWYSPY